MQGLLLLLAILVVIPALPLFPSQPRARRARSLLVPSLQSLVSARRASMYITDCYEDEEPEVAIKVVIVGNGNVGKSSLIQRYCRGIFTSSYKKTIGVDFLEKQLR